MEEENPLLVPDIGDGEPGLDAPGINPLTGEFSLENYLATQNAQPAAEQVAVFRTGTFQLDILNPGEFVTGVAALEQSIYIILSTVPGSQPFRPSFGSDIWGRMDLPANISGPLLAADVKRNLTEWEPRIRVDDVTYEIVLTRDAAGNLVSGVRLGIKWFAVDSLGGAQTSDIVVVTPDGGSVEPGIYFILATDAGNFIQTDEGENIAV